MIGMFFVCVCVSVGCRLVELFGVMISVCVFWLIMFLIFVICFVWFVFVFVYSSCLMLVVFVVVCIDVVLVVWNGFCLFLDCEKLMMRLVSFMLFGFGFV